MKINSGILGRSQGKVGNVITQNWRGTNVVRSAWENTAEPSTAQLTNRSLYKSVLEMIKNVLSVTPVSLIVYGNDSLSSVGYLMRQSLRVSGQLGQKGLLFFGSSLDGNLYLPGRAADNYVTTAQALAATSPIYWASKLPIGSIGSSSYRRIFVLVCQPSTDSFYCSYTNFLSSTINTTDSTRNRYLSGEIDPEEIFSLSVYCVFGSSNTALSGSSVMLTAGYGTQDSFTWLNFGSLPGVSSLK